MVNQAKGTRNIVTDESIPSIECARLKDRVTNTAILAKKF
jgi:hypothetical protein